MKFITSTNRLHQDLSQKLVDDLYKVILTTCSLAQSIKATREETAGIVFSTLVQLACWIEVSNDCPTGLVEAYLAQYRAEVEERDQ